jgi:hypothetical protein
MGWDVLSSDLFLFCLLSLLIVDEFIVDVIDLAIDYSVKLSNIQLFQKIEICSYCNIIYKGYFINKSLTRTTEEWAVVIRRFRPRPNPMMGWTPTSNRLIRPKGQLSTKSRPFTRGSKTTSTSLPNNHRTHWRRCSSFSCV